MNLLDLSVKVGVQDLASAAIASISNAAKVGFAGVAAASTAVVGLTKSSFDAYASYEQLVGGVDKLFGSASQQLQAYADAAYQTSGMSANQYMTQVTSFSAALITSLGGDVAKAAEQADVAMRAISDNVNVFGSNMEDVQNAFQGFAKQNYTMLDNLKLGYGGTKSEMERLIKDANEFAAANEMAADLSIDSFSDIVTAIELIQEKQGIAGTTAKEAAGTIEGSVNMAKAAWENFVTALGTGDASRIGDAADKLMQSFVTAAENVIPRVETIIVGMIGNLPNAISTLGPVVADSLANLIMDAGEQVHLALTETFGDSFTDIFGESFEEGVGNVVNAIESSCLADAVENTFGLMSDAVTSAVDGIGQLTEAWGPTFTDALELVASALELVNSFMGSLGQAINDWVLPAVEQLAPYVGDLFQAFSDLFTTLQPLFDFLGTVVGAVITVVIAVFSGLVQIVTDVVNAFNGFVTFIGGVPEAVGSFIQGVIDWFAALPGEVKAKFDEIVQSVQDWVSQVGTDIGTFFQELPNNILSAIGDVGNLLLDVGKTIIDGLWNGLKEAWSGVTGWFSDITSAIPQIKGPYDRDRKLLTRNGQAIMQGLAEGLADGWGDVEGQLGGYTAGIEASISPKVSGASVPASSAAVIGWLADNLPSIIAECTPVMGQRDFGRAARRAAVYA